MAGDEVTGKWSTKAGHEEWRRRIEKEGKLEGVSE